MPREDSQGTEGWASLSDTWGPWLSWKEAGEEGTGSGLPPQALALGGDGAESWGEARGQAGGGPRREAPRPACAGPTQILGPL